MRQKLKLALLLSTALTSSAAFAQNVPPAQNPTVKPGQRPAQVAQGQPAAAPGSRSQGAGAGQTAAAATPAWVVPAAIAAGVVAVAVIAAQDDSGSTPNH